MRTIYKYELAITDEQTVDVHFGEQYKLIHAGLDPKGMPCVWAEVDSEATRKRPHTVFIVGTGNPLPARASHHLGSFTMGQFVWHVYC